MKQKSEVWKGVVYIPALFFLLAGSNSFGEVSYFFEGEWKMLGVQEYDFGTANITGFEVSGPDGNGYVTLSAVPVGGSAQPILQANLKNMEFQSYTAPVSTVVKGFRDSSDADYIYLKAEATDGSSGEIMRAKWKGVWVQTAEATDPNVVHKFVVLDNTPVDGYVLLGFESGPMATEFLSWECVYQSKAVRVSWATDVELGSYKWIVDRKKEQDTSRITIYEEFGRPDGGNYIVVDSNLTGPKTYYYRLFKIDGSDTTYYGEKPIYVPAELSPSFDISNNPSCSDGTEMSYTVPEGAQNLQLTIYDKTGRLICILINGKKPAGQYKTSWDGRDDNNGETKSGVYFVKFELVLKNNKKFERTEKIVLVK